MNDRAIYHSVEPFRAEDPTKTAYRDVLISLYQPLSESPQYYRRSLPLTTDGIATYLSEAELTSQEWSEEVA